MTDSGDATLPQEATSDFFSLTMACLEAYFPALAQQIKDHRDQLQIKIETGESNDVVMLHKLDGEWGSFHPPDTYFREKIVVEMNGYLHELGKTGFSGFVFFGLDAGLRLSYMFENVDVACPLFVVERHIEVLKAVMRALDLRALLSSQKVFIFCGEDAKEQMIRFLEQNRNLALPFQGVITSSEQDLGFYREAIKYAMSAVKGMLIQGTRDRDESVKYYNSLTCAELRTLFEPAAKNKLHVLGDINTETKVMQHVMRDCMDTFQGMGHGVRVLEEGGVRRWSFNHCFYPCMREFQPNLFFRINHTSKENDGLIFVSDNLVTVTWVQDFMVYLFNDRIKVEHKIGRYDQILAMTKYFIRDLKKAGFPASRLHLFYFGARTDLFYPVELNAQEKEEYDCDVSFIAHYPNPALAYKLLPADVISVLYSWMVEHDRYYLDDFMGIFKELQQSHSIALSREACERYRQIHGDISEENIIKTFLWPTLAPAALRLSYLERIRQKKLHIYGDNWDKDPRFQRNARGKAAYGSQINKICNASKINVNLHVSTNNHNRIFNTIACGGFVLTRLTPEDESAGGIADLFEIGREIEVFRTKEEFEEKIEYYLTHESERLEIARRGRERLLREHTMQHRMQQVLDIVYQGLAGENEGIGQ